MLKHRYNHHLRAVSGSNRALIQDHCRARLSAYPAATPLLRVHPVPHGEGESALLEPVSVAVSSFTRGTQIHDTAGLSGPAACLSARLPHTGDQSPRQRAAARKPPLRALTHSSSAALILALPPRPWRARSRIRTSYPPCASHPYTGTAKPAHVNMIGLVLVESCSHAVTTVLVHCQENLTARGSLLSADTTARIGFTDQINS